MRRFECTECRKVHTHVEWNWATLHYLDEQHHHDGHTTNSLTQIEWDDRARDAWFICPSCGRQITRRSMKEIGREPPLYEPPVYSLNPN